MSSASFGPWGAAIGATAGLGLGAFGAASTNSAIKRSMASTVAQSAKALETLQFQTAVAAQRYANDARRTRGAIRVAAAGAGMAGSDLMALQRQTSFDADLNVRIAKQDSQNKATAIIEQTKAQLAGLANSYKNVLLSGLEGGVSGALSGYLIGGMFDPKTAATAASGGGGWQSALGVI